MALGSSPERGERLVDVREIGEDVARSEIEKLVERSHCLASSFRSALYRARGLYRTFGIAWQGKRRTNGGSRQARQVALAPWDAGSVGAEISRYRSE